MSCNRIKQGYDGCSHVVDNYDFCGGSHDDTHDEREKCYNSVSSGPGTSQRAQNRSGKCPDCMAKEAVETNGVCAG